MSKGLKASDIVYSVVVPCIVAFLIVAFPFYLGPALDPTLRAIFISGFGEAILIIGVPICSD
jgi:membrane-associated HD superfamily phosphohydrolase